MNKNNVLIIVLAGLMMSVPAQAITRTSAAAITAAVGMGSFGGIWKWYYEESLPRLKSLIERRFYEKESVRVSGALSLGIGAFTGLILYQYTPGPRYRAAKDMLKPVEMNALAAMKLDVQNLNEIMEASNCFDTAFAIPLVSASQQLEVMGVVLDNAGQELAIAHEDEPAGTSLKYKIAALLDDVNRMKKNVAANKRFIKLMPGWREALTLYNQQIQVNNQSTMAQAAQLHSQAAERSSWSLVFLTIADWVKIFCDRPRN